MAENRQDDEKLLGHDPFEGMDLSWLDEDEPPAKPTMEAAPEVSVPEPALGVTAITPVGPSAPQATFHFPADFRWGVATAAHQVEGDNTNNDWWLWEQEEGHIKDGRRSGKACEWWKSTDADFDRAAEIGLNAMRLSVDWSRVEPSPGEYDDAALARYREMLQGLRARNIEPMVTLHHFANPQWLAEQGGWENPETVDRFSRFARHVTEGLGDYCDLWCTINEPNVYTFFGYLDSTWPPGKADFKAAMLVIRHLLLGHAAAYGEIHDVQPGARVGLAHQMRVFDPANPRSPLDKRGAQILDRVFNQLVLIALTKGRWAPPLGFGLARGLRNTLDWIGLNYYTRHLIAFDRTQPQELYTRRLHAEDAELLDGDYGEFYPDGLFRCVKRLARLDLPIYITEHGTPDDDDDQRPRHLLAHLLEVWHAIQVCYPVMGYYHWTLVDNFEWAEGWSLRFGLIEVDPDTQVRTPRRSASLYADIIRANAITPRIIDSYAPEARDEMLPR
jgi:beta-glucosidase